MSAGELLFGGLLAVNAAAFFLYGLDKWKAVAWTAADKGKDASVYCRCGRIGRRVSCYAFFSP